MQKTVLITGSTDGIGYATAKNLLLRGHKVLMHGRNKAKCEEVQARIEAETGKTIAHMYVFDLSILSQVKSFSSAVLESIEHIDILINNAGVFKMFQSRTVDNLDARFVVNCIAPYILTRRLLPLMDVASRVVNLSSAAQATVSIPALLGKEELADDMAYAQSKLALTMWSYALSLEENMPSIIAVNPKSFLGSKMVKEAYNTNGYSLDIGADILSQAALSPEFSHASGKYFDNDRGTFALAHPDTYSSAKNAVLMQSLNDIMKQLYAK